MKQLLASFGKSWLNGLAMVHEDGRGIGSAPKG
jgi:hypothetical protein